MVSIAQQLAESWGFGGAWLLYTPKKQQADRLIDASSLRT